MLPGAGQPDRPGPGSRGQRLSEPGRGRLEVAPLPPPRHHRDKQDHVDEQKHSGGRVAAEQLIDEQDEQTEEDRGNEEQGEPGGRSVVERIVGLATYATNRG